MKHGFPLGVRITVKYLELEDLLLRVQNESSFLMFLHKIPCYHLSQTSEKLPDFISCALMLGQYASEPKRN